jgi:hypothetical protein
MKTLSNIFKKNISSAGQSNTNNFLKRKKPQSSVFDFLELLKRWPDMIGEKIAKVTEPVKISNKKLIIYTAHSAFSQQLAMMQSQILEKVKKVYPATATQIKSLSFVTKDTHFSQKKKDILSGESTQNYKKENKLNKYSPTYQRYLAQAEDLFSDIQDQSIKDSLIKIFITSKDS